MKHLCLVVLATIVTGCASGPPLPPECEGPLVPINAIQPASPGGPDATRPRP